MTQAVTARWDGFLANVKERFHAIMEEAVVGCPQLFEESGHDPIPMGNAWNAIDRRAQELETKIENTWNDQVDPAFENAGAAPQQIAQERWKGDQLRDYISFERERNRIAIYANVGRRLFEIAKAEHGVFNCQRCGVPIQIPFTFRALNVPCTHCRTVNGFEPGTKMRMGEICIHPLCEEASWNQWVAMRQAENVIRRSRGTNIDMLKNYERAQIAFWRAYLSARIQMMPETAAAFQADLQGKMRHFYDSMEREGAWINAGRPRELV